jgi:S-adenosylmethionine hydrolase
VPTVFGENKIASGSLILFLNQLSFMQKISAIAFCMIIAFASACNHKKAALVFQTDFGLKDGAVSAMKGVANGVDPSLRLYDITHEIPAYNIWEAACRLQQTAPYWPSGTVFVSVIDPGVGTERRSIVMKTKTGHYFVTPDNGTLTLVAEDAGIESIREIDENLNRRQGSAKSYTFHGRDVYAYTGARLASGAITFEQVGKLLDNNSLIKIPYTRPEIKGDSISGTIPVLDIQYGNVWTNIPDSLLKKWNLKSGDSLNINIYHNEQLIKAGTYRFANTFGEVAVGMPMVYFNSLMNLSLAINEGNFADSFHIRSGAQWKVVVKKK